MRHLSRVVAPLLLADATAALANASPAPTGAGVAASGFQTLIALAIVLAAIAGCAWLARRLQSTLVGSRTRALRTVAALSVGPRESVVVVEIAGQWLVLGVAPGRVQSLARLPANDAAELSRHEPTATGAPRSFAARLRRAVS